MFCKTCEQELSEDNFLIDKTECYKCIYKKKTYKDPSKKKERVKCRICGQNVRPPRTVFCCDDCADIGWLRQREGWWVRKTKNVMPSMKMFGKF